MIWERFLEELAKDCALVKRLALVLKRRDETARVEVEQRFRLVVRIDLDVLVLDALLFQGDPRALDERAEPARVQLQRMFGRVCLLMSATMDNNRAGTGPLTLTVIAARPVASGCKSASG